VFAVPPNGKRFPAPLNNASPRSQYDVTECAEFWPVAPVNNVFVNNNKAAASRGWRRWKAWIAMTIRGSYLRQLELARPGSP
jgi:hypothetical protein